MYEHGRLASAQEEAERGVHAYHENDPALSWKFRLLAAEVLNVRGLSQEALSLLKPEIPRHIGNGDLEIQRQAELAVAYSRTGDAVRSEKSLDWAEKRCEATGSPLLAVVLRTRGIIQVGRENFPSAEVSFRRSLQLARQKGDRYLESANLLNLGVTAIQQEHFDASADWSRNAARVARQIGASLAESKALGNLGWAYYKLGDYEQSLDLFERAISQAKKLDSVLDQVTYGAAAGVGYYRVGRLDDAERHFRRSLELAQKIQNRARIIDGLTIVSLVLARKGAYAEARAMCDRAIEMVRADGLRLLELDALIVRGQIAMGQGAYDEARETFERIAEDPRADLSLKLQAEENLARLNEAQGRDVDAERSYKKALATYRTARATLLQDDTRLPFLANAERIYDDYVHFLVERGREVEALNIVDEARATTLAEGLGIRNGRHSRQASFDPRRVAASLRASILYYWVGEERSYLWTVTGDRVKLSMLPPEKEIAAMVQDYRRALVSGRDVLKSASSSGIRLYEVLVAPAKELVAPGARVIVMADGALHGLNFETLLVPDPRIHYWIEDVTVVNAASIRMLAVQGKRPRATGRLLVMGNAVSSNPDYPELAKASLEIQNVKRHFQTAELRAREDATPQSYMEIQPERFGYIHFVAHGISSRLSPLDSAVVLSKSTSDDDSFKLYARQIIERPINAELVTVSTCYGAGTRAYAGEGLVGLTWAFLRAGARNAVGALWEVSDNATPQLMDQFYAGLSQGQPPDAALRAAKLKMLHSQGVFRKPFYWAPFQLYAGS